jgi:DNA-binding response OmpR family regulator
MDGAGFRAAQRQDPAIAEIPTILLSAARDLSEQATALDVTATMPKPFNLDELLALTAQLLAQPKVDAGEAQRTDTLPTLGARRRDDSGW